MEIEQVLPHVLECIDLTRLGPRKVALLELVYVRQGGQHCTVHLGLRELRRFGRSPSQAGYDRRALQELVELGMLRKLPGRGRIANGYTIREPKYWSRRKIRWHGDPNKVIDFFWRLQRSDERELARDGTGQRMFLCAVGRAKLPSLSREVPGHDFDQVAATEFPPRVKTEPFRTDRAGQRATTGEPPHPSLSLPIGSSKEDQLVKTSSSSKEEDGRPHHLAKGLGIAVAKRIGRRSLYGRGLEPIIEAVDKFGDHLDQLYTLAETFTTTTLDPSVAAAEFLDAAEDLAAHDWVQTHGHSMGSQPFSEWAESEPELDPEIKARMLQSITQLRDNLRVASSK